MLTKLTILTILLVLQSIVAPPVTQKNTQKESEDSDINKIEDYMEYHRYLKEVVNALESDPGFRNKLEKADENEIRSGQIADQLEFVSHHVRTRLDEIKRIELQRLKELTEKKRQLELELNSNRLDGENVFEDDPLHHHLDRSNPHTFEIEDLKKLIAKTTEDLAEADKKRREEFKMYEMEKEYKKQERINHTNNEAEREKIEKEYQQMENEHKKHEKLHEPGHKAQLEEVWEQQDHMQQDFDPKTFFMLHDIDGNGLWDQEEVKALFIKELDKMYQQGAHEDDMRERVEEMERMRESVFEEMDKNRDGFIDYQEFLQQTNSKDFNQDEGWQGLDEQKVFSDQELGEYIRQHHPETVEHHQQQQFYPGQELPLNMPQQLPNGNKIDYTQHNYPQVPQGQQLHPQQNNQLPQIPQHQINPNYQQPPQVQNQPPQNPNQPPQVQNQPPQMQPAPQQLNPNYQQAPPQVQNQPPQMQPAPQQLNPNYQQAPPQVQNQPPQMRQAPQQLNQNYQQAPPQVHNQPPQMQQGSQQKINPNLQQQQHPQVPNPPQIQVPQQHQ